MVLLSAAQSSLFLTQLPPLRFQGLREGLRPLVEMVREGADRQRIPSQEPLGRRGPWEDGDLTRRYMISWETFWEFIVIITGPFFLFGRGKAERYFGQLCGGGWVVEQL